MGDYFNNLGSLRNASTEWKTNEWPIKLVLMYYNGKTTINGNAMNFLIEPLDGQSVPTEDIKLVVGQGRSWAALKHDFVAPGTYQITTFDRERNQLATTTIAIEGPQLRKPEPEPVVEEKQPEEPEPEPEVVETQEKPEPEPAPERMAEGKKPKLTKENLLESAPEPVFVESVVEEELTEEEEESIEFESFYIAFGRSVQSGMLMGQNEKFKAVPGGVNASVLFSNNEGFGTETIKVDVWHRPKGGADYDQQYTEMTITIPKDAKQADFKLNIRERGSYKVSLYTGGDDPVWIGAGYVSLY